MNISRHRIMFSTDSGIWNAIANFASNLSVSEASIRKAKQDFDELLAQYRETQSRVKEKYKKEKLEKTLSWPNFLFWRNNLYCFFVLYLSGFRQSALRELRFYLEASARSYYIDSKYQKITYECKVPILREIRKKFEELLKGVPKKTELKSFYHKLCDYVHPSEEVQTDALRDFEMNIALKHPYYTEDTKMLRKTFEYSRCLLLESLKKKKNS